MEGAVKTKRPKYETTILFDLHPLPDTFERVSVLHKLTSSLLQTCSNEAFIHTASLKPFFPVSPLDSHRAQLLVNLGISSSSKSTIFDTIGHFVHLTFSLHSCLCFQLSSQYPSLMLLTKECPRAQFLDSFFYFWDFIYSCGFRYNPQMDSTHQFDFQP